MKVIAEFVDIRNGNRYGPGDWDKIDPPLDGDQIARLKKAGALGDGSEPAPAAVLPASTEMRTEAGEAQARQADATARDHHQKEAAKETKQDALQAPRAAGDDGLAGRTKHKHK